jgi:hypothetical protein
MMASTVSNVETSTASITITIEPDIAAYIEQKNIKDVNGYIVGLLQQEQGRHAKGQAVHH